MSPNYQRKLSELDPSRIFLGTKVVDDIDMTVEPLGISQSPYPRLNSVHWDEYEVIL